MVDDPEAEERVTAHSYGALDASAATSECWLIRIPQAIAEVWDQVPEGTDLGQLVFRKGGSGGNSTNGATNNKQGGGGSNNSYANVKPSITVHVNESLLEMVQQQQQASGDDGEDLDKKLPSVLPLNYSLQAMTKKVPVMHPFTRNPNNGSVKILGIVSRTANMQVLQDQTYRALLKDRLVATNITASRFVKPVEAAESVITKHRHPANTHGTNTGNKKSFGNRISDIGKRMLAASQDGANPSSAQLLQQQQQLQNKRARQFAPDQPIRSVIFELFQQQPFWAVKDLRLAAVAGGATHASTKRAETEIRDILREIGEYHRSGDHKSMWELRKEFQTQT